MLELRQVELPHARLRVHRRRGSRELQQVQRRPRIPVRKPRDGGDRFVRDSDIHPAETTIAIGERAAQDDLDAGRIERPQHEHLRA